MTQKCTLEQFTQYRSNCPELGIGEAVHESFANQAKNITLDCK